MSDMGLTGKAAEDFLAESLRKSEETRSAQLAQAKADAAMTGKEPFDLAKLETLVDPGRMVAASERQRTYEYMYYVSSPQIMSLEELAALIKVLSEY
jgi:hypothetical protein